MSFAGTRAPGKWLLVSATVIASIFLLGAGDGPIPGMEGRVTDLAQVFSPEQRRGLEQRLAEYEQRTTHQIAVLTVQSLNGETIEAFSLRVANAWALGQKGADNGVLVTLAPAERQGRIELGTGMSRYISDAETSQIIETAMIPAFRRGEYAEGLSAGVEKIMELALRYEVSSSDRKP